MAAGTIVRASCHETKADGFGPTPRKACFARLAHQKDGNSLAIGRFLRIQTSLEPREVGNFAVFARFFHYHFSQTAQYQRFGGLRAAKAAGDSLSSPHRPKPSWQLPPLDAAVYVKTFYFRNVGN